MRTHGLKSTLELGLLRVDQHDTHASDLRRHLSDAAAHLASAHHAQRLHAVRLFSTHAQK
jgi:hypothetical protein